MKKCLTVLIVMLATACMLFANGTAETKSTDEPIELVYWSHYGQSPAFVQAFADSVNIAAKLRCPQL